MNSLLLLLQFAVITCFIWNLQAGKAYHPVCFDGTYQKQEPEPETAGLKQCDAWKSLSCCTVETAVQVAIDASPLYNFNYSHCGTLSEKCLAWFIKNHCFYECSPNIGPWIVPTNSSRRKERFKNLPLCKNDCDNWWDACKDDRTCVENWSKDFEWSTGANACPNNTDCKSFQSVFKNATYFCEHVYGPNDYKIVSKGECMRINFTGENPNDKVANAVAKSIKDATSRQAGITLFPPFHPKPTPLLQGTGTIVSVVIASLILVVFCLVALVFLVKWLKPRRFWHQGVPVQLKNVIPTKRVKPSPANEAEMSFMRYDEDDDEEPELTGGLRVEL